MARIKFGMMMTDARGKLGGQVFSKSRSGAYIATKTIPRNTQSQSQLRRRADFAQFSNEWNNLTDSQQEAWAEWAKEHPLVNEFGDSYTITGRNYFMRNMAMLKLALENSYNPVVTPIFLKKSNYYLGALMVNTINRTIAGSDSSGSRNGYYAIFYLSKPYKTERSFSDIEYRYISGDFSITGTSSRYGRYVSIFGEPKVTDIVYFKLYIITPSGEFFVPQIGQCLIV